MKRFLGWLVAVLILAPMPAWAQQSLGVPIEFDFANPGARNLAMAGIAAGLADDATAVLTNPAGLSILARPEISAEIRARNVSREFASGGSVGALQFSTFDQTKAGLNFLSVVYPAGRVVIGAYRQELSRLELEGERGDIEALGFRFQGRPFDRVVDITTFGGSIGLKISDQVAVGAGINAAHVDSTTTTPGLPSAEGTGIGATFGVQVTPNPMVRIGVSYRRGAEVDVEDVPLVDSLKIPDVIAGGLTIRPNDAFLIAFDVARVAYSDVELFYYLDDAVALLEVPDATEFHAAAEYVFTQSSLLPAIRFGAWLDPSHSPTVTGTRFPDAPRLALAEAVYQPSDDTVHVTGGVGLVPRRGFEVNAGVDISSKAKLFSASFIVRF